MLLIPQILVRPLVLAASAVVLTACGQQGPLYLPNTAGTHRSASPESMLPGPGTPNTIPQPASPASSPKNP